MNWVLDASLALAWALPDETSRQADRFLARVTRESTLWVPALWWYEIANALTTARRRHRVAEEDTLRLVELYGTLPLETDVQVGRDAVGRLRTLAEEYSVSAYDAAYLELAQRRLLGLATLDRRLHAAARRAGVRVIRP
jgi:predicted nucleic acid-binding protein